MTTTSVVESSDNSTSLESISNDHFIHVHIFDTTTTIQPINSFTKAADLCLELRDKMDISMEVFVRIKIK
jgi:hypothetical protein